MPGMGAIRVFVIGIMLVACGGDDDRETGVCRGRPCLTRVDDRTDWSVISRPHPRDARCDFLEDSKFLAPATADAALQDVVFQSVREHPLHLDFMTQVLPEYFGGLAPATYQAITQRRATRQYWAGMLFRLVDDSGATTGYGFDVVIDPSYEERLGEAEIAGIAAQLEARFHLPLAYAPIDSLAIFESANYPTIEKHLPRSCHRTTCPTPGTDCIVVPTELALCGHFMENRSSEDELASKVRLTIAATTFAVPHEAGDHVVPALVGAGEVSADRGALTPIGPTASYEVGVPQAGYVSRVYTQELARGDARYRLRFGVEEGGALLDDFVSRGTYALFEALDPSTPLVAQLGSCTGSTLEPWQIRGDLPDGGRFTIDYGYWPRFYGSSPMFMTRGEVTLGGETAVVTDYFRLVYAGHHHNWNNQFWILFEQPLTYAGHEVHGLWLDQADAGPELDAVHTLDAARQPLDALAVTGYVVERRR